MFIGLGEHIACGRKTLIHFLWKLIFACKRKIDITLLHVWVTKSVISVWQANIPYAISERRLYCLSKVLQVFVEKNTVLSYRDIYCRDCSFIILF